LTHLKYILITAARNEENYIGRTILSIINQSCLPVKWLIISDGSTDKTEKIIESYQKTNNFIELIKLQDRNARSFGSKALAFMHAYGLIGNCEYDCIGNLDADITLDKNYFENILTKMEQNEKLGIAGGVRMDFCNGKFIPIPCPSNSVAGAYQMFRKKCFEDAGGYKPLKYGGIDAVAEITARMKGWEVCSFPELKIYHHRCTGTGESFSLKYRARHGIKFYSIGYHPLFITLKFLKEIFRKPAVIGSMVSIFAYFWAALCRYEKQAPPDMITFLRNEQKKRMLSSIGF
jgi:glycosyltransferase involved in cell wall biosynthesis